MKKLTIDCIADISLAITDRMVNAGLLPDCSNSDSMDEFDTQDIIRDVIEKHFGLPSSSLSEDAHDFVVQYTDPKPAKANEKEEAYIRASGHFLSDHFPVGLIDQDESKILEFIEDNKWDSLRETPETIWDLIEGLAIDILNWR